MNIGVALCQDREWASWSSSCKMWRRRVASRRVGDGSKVGDCKGFCALLTVCGNVHLE